MLLTPPPTPPTHPKVHYPGYTTPTDTTRTAMHPLPMQPTYVYNVSLQCIPTSTQPTYPYNVSLRRMPIMYPYNVSIHCIPTPIQPTYPCNVSQYISLQYISNTYLHHMCLWTFLVTYGKLWLVLVNNGESR